LEEETQNSKLWGGRFRKGIAESALNFSQSIAADSRLIEADIWGSQAHVLMLACCLIISDEEARAILIHLERARQEFLAGKLQLKPELEDVHMNVETYVIEGAGPELGGRLHTARSRNDQVLTDAKIQAREEILETQTALATLQEALLSLAEAEAETVMPGYTHVQHAQPITLGFWASAYASALSRDQRRLSNAYEIVNTSPLGACALAGTSFPTDRMLTARLLGFAGVHEHALDAVSSRDAFAETLFALAMLGSNLSRMAEEMVFWSSYEFGMVTMADEFASGSSIMPQKKNPCIAELVRGRCGRLYAHLFQLLTTLKGLPFGYNRDLQEDKPPLWSAFDEAREMLAVLSEMLPATSFNRQRMKELAGANFSTATELANFLVREKKLPFRKCHEIAGKTVLALVEGGHTFADREECRALLQGQGVEMSLEEIERVTDPDAALLSNVSLGSTAPKEVRRMVKELRGQMKQTLDSVEKRMKAIREAKERTEGIAQSLIGGSGKLPDLSNLAELL
jgi:argininosuccinate lyase